MKGCSNSPVLSDEKLLSYILDDVPLSEEARAHLEQCSICQQRLNSNQRTHSLLLAHLYRRQCPDGTQLSLYCAGLLAMEEQIRIAAHLLACPLCAAEAADTRRFLAEVEPLPVSSPSLSSLHRTVRRVFATLVTSPQPNMIRRGSESTPMWPRQYQTESLNLSLHLSRNSKKEYVLLAIIASTDPMVSIDAFEGMQAELYAVQHLSGEPSEGKGEHIPAEAAVVRTQVDDLGNIVFRAMPPGNYTFVVHLPEHDLVVEDVTVAPG